MIPPLITHVREPADGRELFYIASNLKLVAVPIAVAGGRVDAGVPKPLFDVRAPLTANVYRSNYAVTANGQRFLVNSSTEDASAAPITVVLNWTAGLRK